MQPKQNIPIPTKNENALENIRSHEDEKSILEKQDNEKDYRILGGKSLDTGSHAKDCLSGRTFQAGL